MSFVGIAARDPSKPDDRVPVKHIHMHLDGLKYEFFAASAPVIQR
jgi:hypothetical protein